MIDKVRVHEIATELGIKSKEVVDKAVEMGIDVKTASSSVSMEEAEKIMNFVMNPASFTPPKPKPTIKKAPKKEEAVEEEKTEAKAPVEESVQSQTEVVEEKPATETAVEAPKEEKAAEVSAPSAAEKPLINKVSTEKKRSGLKIVKKKKPAVASSSSESSTTYKDPEFTSNYGKMSAEAIAEMNARSSKKKKKSSSPTTSKSQGNKMDIFGGDMAEVTMDFDEDQVVLLDFREEEARKEREKAIEEERKEREARNAANKNKPQQRRRPGGGQRSVSRGKAKKRRRKDVPDDVVITNVEIPEDMRVYEFA